jgi:hypothetical protein
MVGSQSKVFIWKETETYTKCVATGIYQVWQRIPVGNLKEVKWQFTTTVNR